MTSNLPLSTPSAATTAARSLWPLPAVLAWTLAWTVFGASRQLGLHLSAAWVLAAALGGLSALPVAGGWRRALMACGFPLSSLALGAAVPAWLWLVAAVPLLLAYPVRAWADAPFFPTPTHALQSLAVELPLPPGARTLDAGCGLGHGLAALRQAWPQAMVHGVEWSAPMAWLCARRCRFAQVQRGDMWVLPWSGFDLVYLFQRPESMARAWTKACAEMEAGSWLVSLEFAIPGVAAQHRLQDAGGRPVWAYRIAAGGACGSKKARRGR